MFSEWQLFTGGMSQSPAVKRIAQPSQPWQGGQAIRSAAAVLCFVLTGGSGELVVQEGAGGPGQVGRGAAGEGDGGSVLSLRPRPEHRCQ